MAVPIFASLMDKLSNIIIIIVIIINNNIIIIIIIITIIDVHWLVGCGECGSC